MTQHIDTPIKERASFKVLGAASLTHCLNDATQSLIIAIYPLFKDNFDLTYAQLGLLTLTYQACASVLQPIVGHYTDKKPQPYSLPLGMTCTLLGVLLLAFAGSYAGLLAASILVGAGSAVFHPESSRVAHRASAGRYGLAQSIFQVGGNTGHAFGPLLAAAFVVPHGQRSLAFFAVLPLIAIFFLIQVSKWSVSQARQKASAKLQKSLTLPKSTIARALGLLFLLMFSKQVYTMSLSSYFTFYLIERFDVTLRMAQIYLFVFLGTAALGTLAGGPIGDRIGRKWVIWVSILGAAPFSLALPYMDLFWTVALAAIIGFIMASSFSAILVFAQELMPNHVGTIAGIFFGLAFGLGGIGAAAMGKLADIKDIFYVYHLCSFLPLLGLFTIFLPSEQGRFRH